jgi:hypothetical protein
MLDFTYMIPPPFSSITNHMDHSVEKAVRICSQYAEKYVSKLE